MAVQVVLGTLQDAGAGFHSWQHIHQAGDTPTDVGSMLEAENNSIKNQTQFAQTTFQVAYFIACCVALITCYIDNELLATISE